MPQSGKREAEDLAVPSSSTLTRYAESQQVLRNLLWRIGFCVTLGIALFDGPLGLSHINTNALSLDLMSRAMTSKFPLLLLGAALWCYVGG